MSSQPAQPTRASGEPAPTVMYACDKVGDMIERDDRIRRQVIQLREQIFGRSSLAA